MAFASASLRAAASRWAQGRLADALADAEQALDAERYGWRQLLPCAYGVVVGAARRPRRARGAAAEARGYDPSAHAGSALLAPWHEALGRLALGQRRETDALAHFEAWRDVSPGSQPGLLRRLALGVVYALVSLGRREEARERAREELELARAFGAPRAISRRAARARPRRARAASSTRRSRCSRRRSVDRRAEARLERCRAQLELGAVLRRARRRADAGRVLGDALELARECGARLVEERVLSRARGGRHADAARRAARRRRAEPERAARRRAGDRGAVEPADRRGAVRDAQGGRVAPRQRLPQARRALTPRAGGRGRRRRR